MKINYFSDIHLEFGSLALPDNNADIVIAAGDIGVYDQAIEWLLGLNKPVIYVAGNHEFYNHEYHDTLRMLKEKCANTNIHFLENNSFKFKGVRFLGCSLWTDLFVEGEEAAEILSRNLNDFRKIRFADGEFNVQQFTAFHKHSKAWLAKALARPFKGKTVVVTHHAPTSWSWNDSPNAIKRLAYCNDLKSLFYGHDISAWFHGHTHSIGDFRIEESRILSNTRGYAGYKEVSGFDLNKIVII
ncbi:MAG: metallophosphoesterase [Gammaproteobacteria bacterium]|nr:metallophosphoesterase [Gammaproteobacteria bacterium]MBT4146890.1 metallophosphoesterase [Gammaproteobacteria bacterium]MBT5223001.1 metallophosphoesterase [Gammaproteobacteria bacterium]MBT5825598.1 metallophosphoesterase [Gammaproteobacteria bacterium]MBT5966652.1 metallophosphoesterase [Gammaproteobacteria bacterium]